MVSLSSDKGMKSGHFTKETKTGDIVVQLPRASSILKSHRIDFCCGGNRPIGTVFNEQHLDGEKILNELNQLYADITSDDSSIRWELAPSHQLIEHIIQTHHDYLRKQLPEISLYVEKIRKVHGSHHPELEQVQQYFNELKLELEEHIEEEESHVFPMTLAIEEEMNPEKKNQLIKLVLRMEDEHQKAGGLLQSLRKITLDYSVPEDACMTYQLAFKKLEELESDLFQHIHLENNILFPRFLSSGKID